MLIAHPAQPFSLLIYLFEGFKINKKTDWPEKGGGTWVFLKKRFITNTCLRNLSQPRPVAAKPFSKATRTAILPDSILSRFPSADIQVEPKLRLIPSLTSKRVSTGLITILPSNM